MSAQEGEFDALEVLNTPIPCMMICAFPSQLYSLDNI